jgi:hypothetical protein
MPRPRVCVVQPGQHIMTEPGTMVHMAPSMMPSVELNGCGDACRRCCCAGESGERRCLDPHSRSDLRTAPEPQPPTTTTTAAVYVKYKNEAAGPHIIGLTPSFPARVIPIDLTR